MDQWRTNSYARWQSDQKSIKLVDFAKPVDYYITSPSHILHLSIPVLNNINAFWQTQPERSEVLYKTQVDKMSMKSSYKLTDQQLGQKE